MSPGLLVAWVITLFGMVAGGAIAAACFVVTLQPQTMALWAVFIFCVGAGLTTGLTAARRLDAAPLMLVTGIFLIVLGLAAGGVALASLLNFWSGGPMTLHLWALFAGSLPVGILLAQSGNTMSHLDPAAQRE
jgi:hypothetical protein